MKKQETNAMSIILNVLRGLPLIGLDVLANISTILFVD